MSIDMDATFYECFKNRSRTQLEALIENDVKAIHMAIENKLPRTLELLVKDKKVDINAKDARGSTPLMYACEYMHDHVIMLLEHGAIINDGESLITLLHHLPNDRKDVFEKFMSYKPNVNIRDANGFLPLTICVFLHKPAFTDSLIKAGCDYSQLQNTGTHMIIRKNQ